MGRRKHYFVDEQMSFQRMTTEPDQNQACSFAFVTGIEWDRIHLSLTLELVSANADNATASIVIADRTQQGLYQASVRFDDYAAIRRAEAAVHEAAAVGIDAAASSPKKEVSFAFVCAGSVHVVVPTWDEDGKPVLRLNVTNFSNRTFFPDGTWRIYPLINGVIGPAATFDLRTSAQLASSSRSFLYDGNRRAYVINFKIGEYDKWPPFLMSAYSFGRKSGSGIKKSRIKNSLIGRLARINQYKKARYVIPKKWRMRLLGYVYCTVRKLTRKTRPVILFSSEAREHLSGNLLAINEQFKARGFDEQYTLKYHFDIANKRSIVSRLREVVSLAQADILLVDDYYPTLAHLPVHKHTTIIQAWHAGVGFKLVGYSRFGKYGSPKKTNAHRFYTYAICGSEKLKSVYAENFGIETDALIPTGLPRIDKFLTDDAQTQAVTAFRNRFPQTEGKKLILFAPTFRGRGMTDAYYDYSRIDFDRLYDFCGDKLMVGFRMHHFIDQPVPIAANHSDRFIDLTHYSDGLGLLHAADILITDYSSIIYEYALLNKPMLFYAYDLTVYETIRGFDRDYHATAPGKVCLDFDKLIQALQRNDYEMHKLAAYRNENFDYIDTHASDRVIDWLIQGKVPSEHERRTIRSSERRAI